MDKKYYSKRHKRYNKKSSRNKSPFIMRLNISLGICILAIGVYKLDTKLSDNICSVYKQAVSGNVSFAQIEEGISSISSVTSVSAHSGSGSVTLDEGTLEYIKNVEHNYAVNNSSALSP